MQPNSKVRSSSVCAFTLSVCLSFLAVSAPLTEAQSGRRIPKRSTPSEPAPPAETEPHIEPSTTRETPPGIPILVVGSPLTVGISSMYTNVAVGGCLEELKRSPSVQVSGGKDKNRKEASDYAKASKDTYVVLIQLESEMGSTSNMGGNPRSLYLRYAVFAPGTGKVATQGSVYQGRSAGPIGLPAPNTSASAEWEIRYCGKESAHRVLDALNLARPRD